MDLVTEFTRSKKVVVNGFFRRFEKDFSLVDSEIEGWQLGSEIRNINGQDHVLVEVAQNGLVFWCPVERVYSPRTRTWITETTKFGQIGRGYLIQVFEDDAAECTPVTISIERSRTPEEGSELLVKICNQRECDILCFGDGDELEVLFRQEADKPPIRKKPCGFKISFFFLRGCKDGYT